MKGRPVMTEKKRTRGKPSTALLTDPQVSATAAGLCYITDASPGIRRKRAGQSFTYLKVDGTQLRDPQDLQRLNS